MTRRVLLGSFVSFVLVAVGLYGVRQHLPQELKGWMRALPGVHALRGYLQDRRLGDEGPAKEAVLYDPASIYVDAAGKIYVSDRRHHRIRKIEFGIISTVAGTGEAGYSGDGISANRSQVSFPNGLAGDRSGSLYIADTHNNRIRKISPEGIMTTVAGNGTSGFGGDDGPALQAGLWGPCDLAVTDSGVIYVADTENHRIRRISPEGVITTIAGTGEPGFSGEGAFAYSAMLNEPFGVAVGPDGDVYIADSANHRVRRISADGRIVTIVGTGEMGASGDGGTALQARLNSPQSLFVTPTTEIYIGDEHNNRIRRVSSSGLIETVAGNGTSEFVGDGGRATDTSLNDPEDIWVYSNGSFLVADGDNDRIRLIDEAGVIHTIAGIGGDFPDH